MNVCYVTMVFPAAAETFACLDVRALRDSGVSVSVYAMRPARIWGLDEPRRLFASRARTRAAAQLLKERGLGALAVSHSTLTAVLRGLLFAAMRPRTFLDLIAWLWSTNRRSPNHLLKSLALVPRSLDILWSIERHQPEVVHLFWGHYPAIVGYLVRRWLTDVVVSMFLGAYDLRSRYAGSGALAQIADVVWTHANANVRALERLGAPPHRIRVVHRGVDLEALSDCQPSRKVARRLVTASRLTTSKAVDEVLTTFAMVRERWPDASMVVLGDGPERSRLVSLANSLGIAQAVVFRGHAAPDEVRREMAVAQVFLFMSVVESLPNAVKEAMASRCACVVSATSGIEELVEDGVSGFVVPLGDTAAAACRVDQLLHNPELMTGMGSRARARIAAQFNVKESMQAYHERWADLRMRRCPFPNFPARPLARQGTSDVGRPLVDPERESLTTGSDRC